MQQKMKKPEEDDNEEFDILISFCFDLKECRDALSGILQAGGCFPGFPTGFLSDKFFCERRV